MERMSIAALSVRKLFCLSRRFCIGLGFCVQVGRLKHFMDQYTMVACHLWREPNQRALEWILSLLPDVGHLESELGNSAYCPAEKYMLIMM